MLRPPTSPTSPSTAAVTAVAVFALDSPYAGASGIVSGASGASHSSLFVWKLCERCRHGNFFDTCHLTMVPCCLNFQLTCVI